MVIYKVTHGKVWNLTLGSLEIAQKWCFRMMLFGTLRHLVYGQGIGMRDEGFGKFMPSLKVRSWLEALG